MFINELGITSQDLGIVITVLKTGEQMLPVKGPMRRWKKDILGKTIIFECIGSLYVISTKGWEISFTTTLRETKGKPNIYVISRNVSLEEITLYGDKERFVKDAVMIKLAA